MNEQIVELNDRLPPPLVQAISDIVQIGVTGIHIDILVEWGFIEVHNTPEVMGKVYDNYVLAYRSQTDYKYDFWHITRLGPMTEDKPGSEQW